MGKIFFIILVRYRTDYDDRFLMKYGLRQRPIEEISLIGVTVVMANLLLINLPYNASDREIRDWLESRDIRVKSLHIVRDEVTRTSPAFGHVALKDGIELEEAIVILNGKKLRNQTIEAKLSRLRFSIAGKDPATF